MQSDIHIFKTFYISIKLDQIKWYVVVLASESIL